MLLRRALRELAADGADAPASLREDIDAVVQHLQALGLIDDATFAEARARRLVARGTSRPRLLGRLAAKGVPAEIATEALARLARDDVDPDLKAAIAFARRRRLGPWRPAPDRAEQAGRDTAAMARAGFTWSLVRRVMAAENVAALEAELESGMK